MRFLIDTCVLLWATLEPEHLSTRAAHLIGDRSNEILVSVVSAWEIGIKRNNGRLNLIDDTSRFMTLAVDLHALTVLPITLPHALAAAELPRHHNDPFDRMLIAQAMTEGVPLLSPDHLFAAYAVETVW